MGKAYDRLKEDFWIIYASISASSLASHLLSFSQREVSMTLNDWITSILNSLLFPIIAMGIIYYIVRGFSCDKWGFD